MTGNRIENCALHPKSCMHHYNSLDYYLYLPKLTTSICTSSSFKTRLDTGTHPHNLDYYGTSNCPFSFSISMSRTPSSTNTHLSPPPLYHQWSGVRVTDLHKEHVDQITIPSKEGMARTAQYSTDIFLT